MNLESLRKKDLEGITARKYYLVATDFHWPLKAFLWLLALASHQYVIRNN